MFHFHMTSIKHWMFAYKFCALCLSFLLFCLYSYALTHTHTYPNADPYPLWIPLITVLLFPVMTLKIRSTKPRKIVRYQESLLDCYSKKKVKKIMEDMHECIFGNHSSGHTMAKNILRVGYYWSTMETDCHHHSRTCHKCQIYDDKVHVPLVPLNVLTAPWPFVM